MSDTEKTEVEKSSYEIVAESDKILSITNAKKDYVLCVGGEYYSTIEDFLNEAKDQGVSRRMPTHSLPEGLSILNSRIWLAHGLSLTEKTDDEGKEQHGVIFGHFTPSAVQFIAGPDGEAQYADVIAQLKGKQPDAEIITYVPEHTEMKRKCGYRKIGGTYIVATKVVEGENISPITVLDPHLEFVSHSFRGLMELTPEQAHDLESGKGLNLLVSQDCMECGAPVMVAPSTVDAVAIALRQMAKGREPKFVLRCTTCRNRHKQEAIWEGKARRLAEHLGEECTDANLADPTERTMVAAAIASKLPRAVNDVGKVRQLIEETCADLVFNGWTERLLCANRVIAWVRSSQEEKRSAA